MTEPVNIAVEHEADLCSAWCHGFASTTSFAPKDYRIDYYRGLASDEVELLLPDKGTQSKRATAIQPLISE